MCNKCLFGLLMGRHWFGVDKYPAVKVNFSVVYGFYFVVSVVLFLLYGIYLSSYCKWVIIYKLKVNELYLDGWLEVLRLSSKTILSHGGWSVELHFYALYFSSKKKIGSPWEDLCYCWWLNYLLRVILVLCIGFVICRELFVNFA